MPIGSDFPFFKLTKNVAITAEGGFAQRYTNKTGAISIKGTVVEASSSADNAVDIEEAAGVEPIGFIYNNGIPDGEDVWIVTSGRAQGLMENSSACVRGDWMGVSDSAAGRLQCSTEPPATVKHDQECGHSVQSVTGGTDVLVLLDIHFR